MQDATQPLISGTIVFDQAAVPFACATVSVWLEDVSYADAPARVVAEYVRHAIAFDPTAGQDLPFTLTSENIDLQAHYVVRVHIDVDGDTQLSQGDYINVQSYPVLTFGHPSVLSITVVRL